MRTAKSFLPLLRPFIIRLVDATKSNTPQIFPVMLRRIGVPVNETLDDGHLCLLELLLCITTRCVGEVNCVADLDVICQRYVLDLDAVTMINDQVHMNLWMRTPGCPICRKV